MLLDLPKKNSHLVNSKVKSYVKAFNVSRVDDFDYRYCVRCDIPGLGTGYLLSDGGLPTGSQTTLRTLPINIAYGSRLVRSPRCGRTQHQTHRVSIDAFLS